MSRRSATSLGPGQARRLANARALRYTRTGCEVLVGPYLTRAPSES
jgi:hypothetical protein